MSDPSTSLCIQARSGDLEAASQLVSLHYERLFAWFRRLCGNDADAGDLTQKTFTKAWATLDRYEGRSQFATWLHAIGYHAYVDWLRQRQDAANPGDGWWLSCADNNPGPAEQAADREQAARLYGLVEQLDDATRLTVHVHYYQGLSIAETAEVLGVATSTVKYRLREAVDFLKKHMVEPPLRSR